MMRGGREIRLPPRLQVLDVRDLVDPSVCPSSDLECRSHHSNPIHVVERQHLLARVAPAIEVSLGRQPTYAELATATGLSLRHVAEALDAPRAAVSLNQQVGEDEGAEFAEFLPDRAARDPADEIEDKFSHQELVVP